MLPILAAAAGTAAAQYYTAEQARKANKELQKRNEELFGNIQTPDLKVGDYYGEGISNELPPEMLAYQQNQYAGDYTPEMGQYAQEVGPTTVQESANAKFGRDAQLEALKKFQSNIKSGYDPEFASRMDQANTQSNAAAQSRMNSILQDSQRRGQFGSGAMLAAQMSGAQNAMSEGARQSQLAAVEAQKNMLQQQRDASSMGRNLAADENQLAAQNAEIVNSFNQRSSRAYQQYLQQQNEMRNQAALRNLGVRQDISNQNTNIANRQTTDRYNAARNERDYQNKLVGQRQGVMQNNFTNQLNKANGIAGNNMAAIQQNNQAAQDRNNAIQGVGNAVGGYYQGQSNANERALDRQSNMDIARMKYGYPQQTSQNTNEYDQYGNMG